MDHWRAKISTVEFVTKIDEFEDIKNCFRSKTSTGYKDQSEKNTWQLIGMEITREMKPRKTWRIRKIISMA